MTDVRGLNPSRWPLVVMAALLVATLLAYWPGLGGPLLLDDLSQLNSLIANSAQDEATVFGNYIVSSSGPLGRPVSMATFIADALGHGPDIWWWKYANLMYHLISGLLVFWLSALLIRAATRADATGAWLGGAVVAGLWLLHPLNVSTVLYTVQRMTELSNLFVLAGLVAYVKGRLLHEQRPLAGWAVIGAGFLVFFPLGLFSKENAILYPVYCTLIEFCVLQLRGGRSIARQVRVFQGLLLLAYAIGAALVLTNFSAIVLDGYAHRDFTVYERVLTQFRVLVTYLSQILLPIQGRMGFFHDGLGVSTGLFSPITTLLSIATVIALIAGAVRLRSRWPLVAFGILFFFASHAIESTIFGLELMYEHRNYTGSFGVLLAIAAAIAPLVTSTRTLAAFAVVAVASLALLTLQRAQTWSQPATMYQYMYSVHPDSPRLNIVFSNVLGSAGNYDGARELLGKVGEGIGPEVHGLILDCVEHGRVDDAALAQVATETRGIVNGHTTSSARILVDRAIAGQCEASGDGLLALLDHLLASRIRSEADARSVHYTRARLLDSAQQVDAAVASYLDAQELSNSDARATYLAAELRLRYGQPQLARNLLIAAREIEATGRIRRPAIAERVYAGVADLYLGRGDVESALVVYEEARQALPRRTAFYVNAAELLFARGRIDDAARLLDAARARETVDLDHFQFRVDALNGRISNNGEERSDAD